MNIAEAAKSAQESARKLYGNDIRITVARAIAWGNEDNCIIVTGRRHHAAAVGMIPALRSANVTAETSFGESEEHDSSYSSVSFH